ncbi:Zinc finger and BTB domain-containing protein 17 [Papilio xuthus]|uniref:Zinc finger and BTB domain-containing protein 17 n=1 Tax=Papilio xuthus TaxID=66420 RepID=A0A194QAP5_PAPXU|nr:Zinc finger and BTB domain-containing protein 17 [Papilio xuthus]
MDFDSDVTICSDDFKFDDENVEKDDGNNVDEHLNDSQTTNVSVNILEGLNVDMNLIEIEEIKITTNSSKNTENNRINKEVLGRLIDKLYVEEKYFLFLEEVLSSIDNLLQDIYEGESYDEDIAFNVNVKVEKIEDENPQETNEINENTDNICTVNTRDNKKTFYTQVISIDDSEDENTNSATEESICNREDNLCEFPSSSGIHNETSNDLDKLLYKYLADVEYMNYSPIKIIALIKRNKSKLCIEDYKIKKTTEKTYTDITNEIQNTPENDETEATDTNNIIKNDADSDYEPDSYAIETQLDAEIKRDIEIEEQISKVFKASKCYKKFLDKEASDPIEDIYDNDVCIIVKNEETLVISDSDDEKTLELNDGKDKGNPNIDVERVGSDVDILESNFNNVTVKIENCDFNEEKSNNSVEFKHEYVESMKHIKKEDSIKEEYEDVTDGVMDFFNGVNLDFNTNVKSETCTNECDIDLNDWKINEISSIKKRKIVKNTKRTWKYDLTTYFCSDCTYKGCYKDYINHLTRCKKKHPNCTYCKKTFDNIDEYLTHFTEHKLRYLSCPQCLKNFTLLRYLNNHIILHINELFVNIPNEREQYIENKPYICLLCEELVDIDNFFTHWESHLELNEGGVADEMSDGEGDMKSMMSPEMVEQALEILLDNARNSKNKVCIVCSKNFSRKNDSKRHLIEHLLHEAKVNIAETNAKLRCPMCNVDIRELPAWRQHMRDHAQLKVHEPMNPMSCTECNKTLCSEYALKRHMRVRHSMYQFACPVCKRKFGTCKQRWDHMWNKHKIRKFVADCPICNKQYRRIIDVKNHMKSEHG